MSISQLETSLLLFLDPARRWNDSAWLMIRQPENEDRAVESANRNLVFSFPRSSLLDYLRCSLAAWFKSRRHGTTVRRILYLNDGLLSSVFDAGNADAYRSFSRTHLPHPQGFRRKLARLIPPFWRAEQRFIAIQQNAPPQTAEHAAELASLDYLFFSNLRGKLMLTRTATLISGKGHIFKTTTVSEYADSLLHEQSTIKAISQLLPHQELLHGPQEKLLIQGRHFFKEEYLSGENLREVLRLFGGNNAQANACLMLDRLDAWFTAYRTAFSGTKSGLSSLYAPMLQTFSSLHTNDAEKMPLLRHVQQLLAQLDREYDGVVPITAHNDLWPGNFIVQENHLTAIDWERATPRSTPFFDYFWMIISATLEYLVGKSRIQDYSLAFRQFLQRHDDVCCHAHHKLEHFLEELGFKSSMYNQFMLLFLMEWSIQGFKALGRVTDMDQLARGELAAFVMQTAASKPGTV